MSALLARNCRKSTVSNKSQSQHFSIELISIYDNLFT